MIQPYISVPAQELLSRAAPSVRGYHHHSVRSNHREKSWSKGKKKNTNKQTNMPSRGFEPGSVKKVTVKRPL